MCIRDRPGCSPLNRVPAFPDRSSLCFPKASEGLGPGVHSYSGFLSSLPVRTFSSWVSFCLGLLKLLMRSKCYSLASFTYLANGSSLWLTKSTFLTQVTRFNVLELIDIFPFGCCVVHFKKFSLPHGHEGFPIFPPPAPKFCSSHFGVSPS